jgi:sugar lactone lactonase YvrE
MAISLTKPLIVPEYNNGLVKLYVAHPLTSETVALPAYNVDVHSVVNGLFPGKTARANSCALSGDDLFIANSSPDSQCIFKSPDYLPQGGLAMVQTFVFTLDGEDYVGMAFDTSGNLYAAEGSFLDNQIVMYTGTGKSYPGALDAKKDNYATRVVVGNAGATSYFANLAFDAAGNLWASDYKNHRLVVFDAENLGGTNTYHVLSNLDVPIPVANTDPALTGTTGHLFAEPEGIDFDAAGNLWVANNNDGGGAAGVQNPRTSIVQITPALQSAVLATPADEGPFEPEVKQSGTDFLIYQVPNLADDAGLRPQFGGLQVDRTAERIYINEEIAGKGRGYDIATIAAIGTMTAPHDLGIVSTNPGNGGIVVVDRELIVVVA